MSECGLVVSSTHFIYMVTTHFCDVVGVTVAAAAKKKTSKCMTINKLKCTALGWFVLNNSFDFHKHIVYSSQNQ